MRYINGGFKDAEERRKENNIITEVTKIRLFLCLLLVSVFFTGDYFFSLMNW